MQKGTYCTLKGHLLSHRENYAFSRKHQYACKIKTDAALCPIGFIRPGHATRLSARRYGSAVSPLFIYSVGLQPIVFLKQRLKYFGSENPHL